MDFVASLPRLFAGDKFCHMVEVEDDNKGCRDWRLSLLNRASLCAMSSDVKSLLAHNLWRIRMAQDLTQWRLAELAMRYTEAAEYKVDISHHMVGRIERCETLDVGLIVVRALALALGVRVKAFYKDPVGNNLDKFLQSKEGQDVTEEEVCCLICLSVPFHGMTPEAWHHMVKALRAEPNNIRRRRIRGLCLRSPGAPTQTAQEA